MRNTVRVLFLTGTIGSGKTTVALEAGLLLGERGLCHAVIDLDWLGWLDVGPDFDADPAAYERLIMRNLAAIWPNFQDVGVEHLILTRALFTREPLDNLRAIFPGARITVVRLIAAPGVIEERLRRRDQGEILRKHLQETHEMTIVLDAVGLEDAVVLNEGKPPRAVAAEVLSHTGWI